MPEARPASLGLARHVRWADFGDMAVVMDCRNGRFFGIGPEALDSFRAIAAAQPGESGAEVARALFSEAVDLGWFEEERSAERPLPPSRHRRPWRRFLGLRAFLCYLRVDLSLRLYGFARTYAMAARGASSEAAAAPDPESLLAAFDRGHRFVWNRRLFSDCLRRSLALHLFLKRCGYPARHLIGVRNRPFGSHAWVEAGGRPLLDAPERVATFRPLSTIG